MIVARQLPGVALTGLNFEPLKSSQRDVGRCGWRHVGRWVFDCRMRDPELHGESFWRVLRVLPAEISIGLPRFVELGCAASPRRSLVARGVRERRVGFVLANLQPRVGQGYLAYRILGDSRAERRMAEWSPTQHKRITIGLGCLHEGRLRLGPVVGLRGEIDDNRRVVIAGEAGVNPPIR